MSDHEKLLSSGQIESTEQAGSLNAQLYEYYEECRQMRNCVLHDVAHRKITLGLISDFERGLSAIIKALDPWLSQSAYNEDIKWLKEFQRKIRDARMCLNLAADHLNRRSNSNLKALYKQYEEFTDLLADAMSLLNALLRRDGDPRRPNA